MSTTRRGNILARRFFGQVIFQKSSFAQIFMPTESIKTTSDNNEAAAASTSSSSQVSYAAERVIDNGSFGVVFQAVVVETGEVVAIKKVLLDRRFRNRELKVSRNGMYSQVASTHKYQTTTTDNEDVEASFYLRHETLFLFQWR